MPSSAVRRIEYDDDSRTMSVWFEPDGHRYDYFAVPQDVYWAFNTADSKGRFFNTRIRDQFEFVEVAERSR
jgi:hypothetical protein